MRKGYDKEIHVNGIIRDHLRSAYTEDSKAKQTLRKGLMRMTHDELTALEIVLIARKEE